MQFRPAIFIQFVFAQLFFKFYKNGGIQKIKAQTFQLEGIVSVNQILNVLEQSEVRLSGVTWASYNCLFLFSSILFSPQCCTIVLVVLAG